MIKGIVVLATALLSFLSVGHSNNRSGELTFTQFVDLFEIDHADMADYLSSRGWNLTDVSKATKEKFGYVEWKYYSSPGFMTGGISYFYTGQFRKQHLFYTTLSKSAFNEMKAEAVDKGLRQIQSGVKKRHFEGYYVDYEAENFFMRFTTLTDQSYAVEIFSKGYYNEYE